MVGKDFPQRVLFELGSAVKLEQNNEGDPGVHARGRGQSMHGSEI